MKAFAKGKPAEKFDESRTNREQRFLELLERFMSTSRIGGFLEGKFEQAVLNAMNCTVEEELRYRKEFP